MKWISIFLHEFNHFRKSYSKVISYLIFVLACIYSIYIGFSLQNKQHATIDNIKIDPTSRQTYIGSQEVELTKREFDLLMVLALNEGIVQSRFELLEKVWGYDFEVESNVVDVFIGYLRKKLNNNDHPDLIQTVRGIGFVLRK